MKMKAAIKAQILKIVELFSEIIYRARETIEFSRDNINCDFSHFSIVFMALRQDEYAQSTGPNERLKQTIDLQ